MRRRGSDSPGQRHRDTIGLLLADRPKGHGVACAGRTVGGAMPPSRSPVPSAATHGLLRSRSGPIVLHLPRGTGIECAEGILRASPISGTWPPPGSVRGGVRSATSLSGARSASRVQRAARPRLFSRRAARRRGVMILLAVSDLYAGFASEIPGLACASITASAAITCATAAPLWSSLTGISVPGSSRRARLPRPYASTAGGLRTPPTRPPVRGGRLPDSTSARPCRARWVYRSSTTSARSLGVASPVGRR